MDSVLITMPDTLYEFIVAIAVAQDYSLQLAVGAERKERDQNYNITFRMKEAFKYFEPVLRVVQDNIPTFDYSGWNEKQRWEYDCFIDFNFTNAEKIASTLGQYITIGFNAILGSGASGCPVLKALQLPKNMNNSVLILGIWNIVEAEKLYQFIFNNYPELDIVFDNRPIDSFQPKEIVEYINLFDVVIGPVSPMTLIAVSLGKTCIEIFPNDNQGIIYGHIGKPNYKAVTGTNIQATFLWVVWEELWHARLSSTSSQDVLNKVG